MLRLTQRQTLQQKLTPAQVQYLKVLQLPILQLEQSIKDELEINPLLEEGLEQEEDLENETEPVFEVTADDNGEADANDIDALNIDIADTSKSSIEESIQDNRDDEYSWDEFLDNNEGAATVSFYDNEDEFETPTPAVVSMREGLIDQVRMLHLRQQEEVLAETIIWNIDDDGYLRSPIKSLAREVNEQHSFHLSVADAENVLKRVQRLDPPGIASRDLRECLLTQLEVMPNNSTPRIIAMRVLREAYDLFAKKHFDRIMHQLHINEDMMRKAFDVIRSLNPKPGEGDAVDIINYVIPDFFVSREDDEFVVQLNDRGVPPLRISRAYRKLIAKGRDALSRDARNFLKQKIESAKWFIQSIHQRRQTMTIVMWSIIEHQKEWFEQGKGHLRPLIYKDIADDIEMDISTISRVVNGKYVQTEWGVYELRYFFSEGIVTETGDEIANKEIMALIRDIINDENVRKPLSDQAITNILQQRGYIIARRTVAKYREAMDIPVSRLRKELV